ncbi:MAG: DUF2892 domain-containing protein [Candidatus Kapabacteria bacterium]|nr:DUF2892 domain-containing protein [Candidatus Kapabacteria bacterium]
MKKNLGVTDRVIRSLIAIGVFIAIYAGALVSPWSWILGGLSVIFLLTSLVSFCPIYAIFGIRTCKTAS